MKLPGRLISGLSFLLIQHTKDSEPLALQSRILHGILVSLVSPFVNEMGKVGSEPALTVIWSQLRDRLQERFLIALLLFQRGG